MSRGVTVVEEIVRALCMGIFRGEYPSGSKLPPLRALAKTHSVTLPTMQRAIARMEELGLISVRQGSGVTVLEPLTHAHPSAIPYWMSAFRDDPGVAVKGLGDFLELRTELGVVNLLRVRPLLLGSRGEEVEKRLEVFEESAAGMGAWEALEADFEMLRVFLNLRPQLAYSTVLNVLRRIVEGLPLLVEVAYEQPARNVLGYRTVLGLARDPGVDDTTLREQMLGVLRAYDAITLGKFRAILEREDV